MRRLRLCLAPGTSASARGQLRRRQLAHLRARHARPVDSLARHDATKRHAPCALSPGSRQNVKDAWRRGTPLAVHGLIYALQDGCLRELGLSATDFNGAERAYEACVGTAGGFVPG